MSEKTPFLQKVCQTIDKYGLFQPGERVVVGVSGGPDSLCLLHLLTQLRDEYRIEPHVAHLNHQIRGAEAEADAAFVARLAEEWGLPATIEARDVPAYARQERLALEEAARRVRYSFLAEVARKIGAGCIAVGHNADDQVETVIMHWLRGAGLAGLRGMLPLTEYEGLRLVRPLLEVTRAEIEEYCQIHHLQPRFDRSNLDTTYFRNRLRHELIPYLESYNPNIREVVRRAAKVIAADYDFLRSEVERAWERMAIESEGAISFPLEPWSRLHLSLQRALLREAIRRLRKGLRNINWVHIEDALKVINEKPTGAIATLPQGLQLFKSYDRIVVGERMPRPDLPLLSVDSLPIAIPGVTKLPDSYWQLKAEILAREELNEETLANVNPWQAYLDYDRTGSELKLRQRLPGDRFQPLGMRRGKTLQAFMIDAKVPRHLRDEIPIVVSPRQIVWVAGWRIDERVKVTERSKRILHLEFTKRVKGGKDELPCRQQRPRRWKMMDDVAEILITEEELKARVAELGKAISADYEGKDLLLVSILKGAFMFLADLSRHITIPHDIDFMAISSYGTATESSGIVRLVMDLKTNIEGRNVLIVEDIIDTGHTLDYITRNLRTRNPASLRICTLLNKKERREIDIPLDYVGFDIPNKFVVGYGLDYGEIYRNLPFIGVLKPELYKEQG